MKIAALLIFSCLVNFFIAEIAIAETNSQAEAVTTATTKSTDVLDEKQKNPFGISLFLIGGYTDKQLYSDKPSFDIFDSYISFSYRVSNDLRFSARPAFGYATDGYNKYGDRTDDRARIRDFSLAATMLNLFEDSMPVMMDLKFQPRLYLPTSEASKDQGIISRFRPELEVRYFLNSQATIRYNLSPSYYFQRNTVYFDNSNPKKPNSLKTTTLADLEQTVELSWNMNKYYSLKPAIGLTDLWSNTSSLNTSREAEQFRKTSLLYGVGVEIRPIKKFSFTVGARTEKDLLNSDRSVETSYSFMTGITLY